jgi:hypothetical protein
LRDVARVSSIDGRHRTNRDRRTRFLGAPRLPGGKRPLSASTSPRRRLAIPRGGERPQDAGGRRCSLSTVYIAPDSKITKLPDEMIARVSQPRLKAVRRRALSL